MDKKIGIIEVLNGLGRPEGRKLHQEMIKNNLPKVLEKQKKDGFYSTEDTTEIEEYILNEYKDELK